MSTFWQIPFTELVPQSWYVGRGRASNVGRWDGEDFAVITNCLVYNGSFRTPQKTEPGLKFESYFTADEGSFQPFIRLEACQSNAEITTKIIPVKEMQPGRFYLCTGEEQKVGRWEGNRFTLLQYPTPFSAEDRPEIIFEKHILQEGTFAPIALINEGEVIEPYLESGIPAGNYAKVIQF